jgi:hypothetical protein
MHEQDSSEYDEICPNEVTFFPRRLTLDGSTVARLLDLSITAKVICPTVGNALTLANTERVTQVYSTIRI